MFVLYSQFCHTKICRRIFNLNATSSVVDLILSIEVKLRKENILNVRKQLQLKKIKILNLNKRIHSKKHQSFWHKCQIFIWGEKSRKIRIADRFEIADSGFKKEAKGLMYVRSHLTAFEESLKLRNKLSYKFIYLFFAIYE